MDTRTVGQVARLAGISVRTLHHYDEVGLLEPSERRANGYRAYTDDDLGRLQRILTYRELDLGLDEIRAILAGEANAVEALRAAQRRLEVRVERLLRIGGALASAIQHELRGEPMQPEEKLEVFGDFDPTEFEAEAEERWGSTDAYAESMRRTRSYTADDWKRHQLETTAIYQALLSLMAAGTPADSAEAAEQVDAHRDLINRWFYDCSPEVHAGLGQMYVADPRFTANIDKAGPGLAAYLSAAIEARYGG